MINKQCVVFVNTLKKSHPCINYSVRNYVSCADNRSPIQNRPATNTHIKLLLVTIQINKGDIKLAWTRWLTDSNFLSPLVHTMRFFPIVTLLIAANGVYRMQWKCSHYATATTSPTLLNKKQIVVAIRKNAQCE